MKKLISFLILCVLAFLLFFFFQKFNGNDFTTQSTDGYDLALIKTLSDATQAPFVPGDIVTYSISVINQGTQPSGEVVVTDYVSDGLEFLSSSVPSTVAAGDVMVSISNIPVGSQEDFLISYLIEDDFAGGDITNYAEISSDSGTDVDSTPDDNKDNDCIEDNEINKLGC